MLRKPGDFDEEGKVSLAAPYAAEIEKLLESILDAQSEAVRHAIYVVEERMNAAAKRPDTPNS
jgi:hypothetical protein